MRYSYEFKRKAIELFYQGELLIRYYEPDADWFINQDPIKYFLGGKFLYLCI